MLWSEENVKLLTDWYVGGLSSSLIVDEFGKLGMPLTRNSVIGKIHRLGLPPPSNRKWKKRQPPIKKVVDEFKDIRISRRSSAKFESRDVRPIYHHGNLAMIKEPASEKNVLLRHSKDGQCKAILGYRDGILADAFCCGEDAPWIINSHGKLVASPWCPYHRKKYIEKKNGRDR